MTRNQKIVAGSVMTLLGVGLATWSLRDPDAAYREGGPPKHDTPAHPTRGA